MAARYLRFDSGRIAAACTVIGLLVAAHSSPAFASSNLTQSCADEAALSLELRCTELPAEPVSHKFEAAKAVPEHEESSDDAFTATRYQAPKAATLREVFEQSSETEVAEQNSDDDALVDSDERPTIKARVPGISDGDLARFKRHMYRRDI